MKRFCKKCVTEKEENEFYTYYKHICKRCHLNHTVEKRDKDKYRSYNQNYYKEWYAKNGRNRSDNYSFVIAEWHKNNPEKVKAHRMVQKAVKDKIIFKPEMCTLCTRATKLNGHHEDYSKPLDVIWLCHACHKDIHLGNKKLTP